MPLPRIWFAFLAPAAAPILVAAAPVLAAAALLLAAAAPVLAAAAPLMQRAANPPLSSIDVFEIEYASDPRISPDGSQVVYVRNFNDIQEDRRRANLWLVSYDGKDHRALTTGNVSHGSPRWSPNGKRLLYVSSEDGSSQLYLRWMDTGQTAKITRLPKSPSGLSWSPDGQWIAFTMFVPGEGEPLARMPKKPEGAKWADAPKVITALRYRSDGSGFLEQGHTHVFVVPAEGGTPRQLTSGDFDHGGAPEWTPDGKHLLISANRDSGWEYDLVDSEIYEIEVATGAIRALTDRAGPDGQPAISPNGRRIAYVGFDDRVQGYQVDRLYVMDRDGGNKRLLTGKLDREVSDPQWSGDGRGVFFEYDDEGDTKIGFVTLDGRVTEVADRLGGGTRSARPYGGGSFTAAANGRFAYTHSLPSRPGEVAVGRRGTRGVTVVTDLNGDLLGQRRLGEVEEHWTESSADGRKVQYWTVKPPDFVAGRKYPMILEIHGGPFANYGARFSEEVQLYAARGYLVVYANPRGSSSYGEEFGNLIHHAYPGQDYDDLMSVVDDAIARGNVDPDNLFVTGGSGGGTLSAWIVGKTDRFRAAVVQKPVINWYSFVLTADAYPFFYKYWFPGFPWEHAEHYLARSPISLVGNVTTPTMLLTGESDFRTPMSETEQYYQALKLRKVDTALVRLPGASHGLEARPSQLVAKVEYALAWFDRYRTDGEAPTAAGERAAGDTR